MGAALAAALTGEVLWPSDDRSTETALRATHAGIRDVGSLQSLIGETDVIISVCPPSEAVNVARRVAELGFEGLYVDLNAVAPSTARQIGSLFGRFVDGGIVGRPPPAPDHGGTRVYLSGKEANEVAALFEGPHLETNVIGSDPGSASAVKMAYAAWTKGSSALLLSVAALAIEEGVFEELVDEWALSLPELSDRLRQISDRVGPKAWRFVGEMEEIARAYADANIPDGFHISSAEIYSRLAPLSDGPPGTDTQRVLRLILGGDEDR